MKAVHFGAGNIGRGFIGLLLAQSGYDVCFVTRNKRKISLLQQNHSYKVTLANAAAESCVVNNVTATSIENDSAVREAMAETDLVTTAVGSRVLKHIAPRIAQGIAQRIKKHPRPLNIIACENGASSSTQLKKLVYAQLPEDLHAAADQYIAFPNTVVDRIVPVQQHSDPTSVTVEPFYEWIVDRSAIIGALPALKGVKFVDSLTPYVERKLFSVNTGHCSGAYYGYLEGFSTIQDVMRNPRLNSKVEAVMQETGALLIRKYHFNPEQHQKYIRTILQRFSNPLLTDDVVRVGRCPIRKLSPNERLVKPTVQAYNRGLDTYELTSVIAAALLFTHRDDTQGDELQTAIRQEGIHGVITKFMGIPADHPIQDAIAGDYLRLKETYLTEKLEKF